MSGPSIIAADVRLKGNLDAKGEIQLDGAVEGDIHCASLTVGDTGYVKGTVVTDTLVLRGSVEGQIRGRSVRLEKDSRLVGDLWHESISVEAGAIIEGHLTHSDNPLENNDRAATKPVTLYKPAQAPLPDQDDASSVKQANA